MQRFERTFKIWDFYITHSQLLLRSHKTVTHPKNIDIIFGGVQYVELPTTCSDSISWRLDRRTTARRSR